ncbi:MAG: hypothetical protein ACLT63_15615 [Bacteroides xylanisolvens]
MATYWILRISANEFKERCINQYKQYIAHNNTQSQFSEDTRTLANLHAFDCGKPASYPLLSANSLSEEENITREQACSFLDIHLPDDFHTT